MTWTWNDDDPATAASAENFNTHIENRLRALEAGGGGGGGVGPEVDVYDKLNDAANNEELSLEDPTKGAFVIVQLYGQAADAVVKLGSFTGSQAPQQLCESDGTATLTLLVSPGETYYLDRNPNSTPTADPQVNWAIEKTIG